jgi:hypothetical protein
MDMPNCGTHSIAIGGTGSTDEEHVNRLTRIAVSILARSKVQASPRERREHRHCGLGRGEGIK